MIRIAPYYNGFGDLWAITSHCCRLSRREGETVRLSRWSTKAMWNREKEIRAILASFEEGWADGVAVDPDPFPESARFSVRDHLDPYVPTRRQWRPNDSRILAYQVEPPTDHRPDRRCEPALIDALREHLPGWELVALGKQHQRKLDDIIEILSQAECFVGIDSGMSHIAHSVGVPVFLKDYAELEAAHPNKAYIAFRDASDLKLALSQRTSASKPARATRRLWLRMRSRRSRTWQRPW